MREEDAAPLAARDPAIPGLATLLSADRLAEALGHEVRPRRVRYKPGTSVVVAYDTGGERRWAAAFVDPVKLRTAVDRAGRAGFRVDSVPGAGSAVAGPALADRALVRTVSRVSALVPGLFDEAVILRHNPHRRLVVRARDRVFKISPAGTKTAGLGSIRLDRMLRPERIADGVTSTPWWGAGDLAARPGAPSRSAAAGALASLHRLTPPRSLPVLAPLVELDAAVGAVTTLAPALGPRVAALAGQLAAGVAGAADTHEVPLHGDFSADQVLVDGAEVRLIDFDRAGRGPLERDLGSFAADARLRGRGDDGDAFVAEYRARGGGPVDAGALRTWTSFSLLMRAVEPFRDARSGWAGLIDDRLTAAEEAR
ncbi:MULTISPECIES: phosphotransferase family protein [unclassified Microbacterium]|uniref:phosphotransferase family protein n=1 Tax=unclassified Microbacterium TaxID=2609290 RepID=UPI0038668E3D